VRSVSFVPSVSSLTLGQAADCQIHPEQLLPFSSRFGTHCLWQWSEHWVLPEDGVLCTYLEGAKLQEVHNAPTIQKIITFHLRVVVSIPPKYAVSNFMGYLKGKLATRLFARYERLGRRYSM
jgi:hypothetical protein